MAEKKTGGKETGSGKKEKKPETMRESAEFQALEKFLRDDLAARGLVGEIYEDQVKSYLDFLELEREARQMIRLEGLNIWDERRGSWQQNPAFATMHNSRKMALAIYKSLGYEDEAKKAKAGADEDVL